MSSQNPRWSWLTVFAGINLVCWLLAAVVVGVVASPGVNLGVEAFVREKQATAVAWSKQVPTRLPSRTPRPTSAAPPRAAAAEVVAAESQPTEGIIWPSPTTPVPTTGTPTTTKRTPYATRTPRAPMASPTARQATPRPTQVTASNPAPSAPEPTVALLSNPLLMANPDMEALVSLDAEIRQSATGRPVQIRYQEEALNREIASLLASDPDLPYQNVRVDLHRGQVTLTGDVLIMGLELSTKVQGNVVAQNCQPQIKIQSVSVGGVLTPRFIKDQVSELVQDSMSWYPADYPLCLEQIVLEEERATIYGSRR